MSRTAFLLAGIYFKAQDYKHAEPLFREAVETLRRQSAIHPHEYEPSLAGTLQAISLLYDQQGNMEKAGAAAEEAIEVFKRLAAANPAQYGDDLASCYYLESDSLNSKDASRACALIGQASEAAYTPTMKQGLQDTFRDCSKKAAVGSPK